MKSNVRYACWLIDNIKFSGKDFSKIINFKGEQIELLVTNYENSKNLEAPFDDWIHNKIIRDGMMNVRNTPIPLNSIFLITRSAISDELPNDFPNLLRLCMKLVYYQPTLISHAAILIPNAVITIPIWENFKNCHTVSNKEIDSESFEKVILYFDKLNELNRKQLSILEEVYKISGIDDVLIELLSLYSFIEGFWWNTKSTSNLSTSFQAMLKDYAPGREIENKNKRKSIIQTIEAQNGILRNPKLDDMRHILAHGMYKQHESYWDTEKWKTLYDQRNLLFDVVIASIINRLASEA